MKNDNKLRLLIIDDNPAIHQDFKKIFNPETPNQKLASLNKLLFDTTPDLEAPDNHGTSFQLPSFQIDSASQGREGIALIKQALEENRPYALAFVDIRMPPGLDGVETIKLIWELDKDIQIVICTAYSDYTWEETVASLGINDGLIILKKPFDSLSVRQLAAALTKKWQLMLQVRQHTDFLEKTVQERTNSLEESLRHHLLLEEKLAYQATHDALTSLPNRVLLMGQIEKEISRANRQKHSFVVMFIDLDRFKLINDSLGHEVGDKLLINVIKSLQAVTRKEDTIGRLGGDEFILVMATAPYLKETVINIAIKALAAISSPMKIDNRELSISASIGISVYPLDGEASNELLQHADLAMYRAKELGGNQFQFYSSELNQAFNIRLEQEVAIRQGLINNEFFLVFQPQWNTDNNSITAVEALVRWQHPKLGLLLPMDFIPLAEETGLIVPLGEWILKEACRQNKKWQDLGLLPVRIAVNIATKQFMQPNIVEAIRIILMESGLSPEYLEIEVTENVIISNINVIQTISEIKKLGVRITLDDFGTGSAGLNYLRNLPIDQLKIPETFVKNISSSYTDEVIIKTIIAMANSLSMGVIAEGVENQNQLDFLKPHNCQTIQGHLFSKPVTGHELESLLAKLKNNK